METIDYTKMTDEQLDRKYSIASRYGDDVVCDAVLKIIQERRNS